MPCRSGPCEGKDADAREIGRRSGCATCCRGRVQSSPERIRVNVQLFDGRDGRSVWGNTFESERTAQDLFDLQDELTQQVVNEIAGSHGALARAELPPGATQTPRESRQSRLRVPRLRLPAELTLSRRDPPGGPRLPGTGRRGRARLRGRPGLAGLFLRRGVPSPLERARWRLRLARARAAHGRARGDARRQEPACPRVSWGWRHVFSGRRRARGVAEMRRAVELNPHNPIVLGMLAWWLANQGEFEQAVPLAQRAKALNPYNSSVLRLP